MRGSRVLVIGGGGVLGTHLARALVAEGHRALRAVRPGSRVGRDAIELDLADERAVASTAADHDLVVTTVRAAGLVPERAVLTHGGTLLSVASLTAGDRRDLAATDGAAGLAVVHAGLVPGVATLLLADLLRTHPEADGAEIVLTLSTCASGGRHGKQTAAIPLLRRRRRHPTAVLDIPAPFGRRRCMAVGDGDEGFFGELGGNLRRRLYWSFREPLADRGLLALNELGACRLPPAWLLRGWRGVPAALSSEPKRDVVAVSLGGRRLGGYAICGRGDYAMAVAATVAFVAALLERRRRVGLPLGCLGAEELFSIADLGPSLTARDVTVRPLPAAARMSW